MYEIDICPNNPALNVGDYCALYVLLLKVFVLLCICITMSYLLPILISKMVRMGGGAER